MQAMYPGGTEQDGIHPLLAYKSTSDPDTMYLHEAMKQPDKVEFLKAMDKEVKDQRENGNFSLIKKTELPKDAMVLPAVWKMKQKRDIKIQRIKMYKARLEESYLLVVK